MRSAAEARAVTVWRDLAYGPEPEQRLDLYLPEPGGEPRGMVLALHGGGWRAGGRDDPRTVEQVALPLAGRGHVVASAGYRLAPGHPLPAPLADVERAVDWLRGRAGPLGGDPGRLAAVGGSAGGHLALLAAVRGAAGLRCAVGLLAPTDLRPPVFLPRVTARLHPELARHLDDLVGVAWEDDPDAWRRASPACLVSPASAPCLLIHGRRDPLVPVDQALRLARALRRAGVEAPVLLLGEMGHDPDAAPAFRTRFDAALQQAWRFVERHLARPGGGPVRPSL